MSEVLALFEIEENEGFIDSSHYILPLPGDHFWWHATSVKHDRVSAQRGIGEDADVPKEGFLSDEIELILEEEVALEDEEDRSDKETDKADSLTSSP